MYKTAICNSLKEFGELSQVSVAASIIEELLRIPIVILMYKDRNVAHTTKRFYVILQLINIC